MVIHITFHSLIPRPAQLPHRVFRKRTQRSSWTASLGKTYKRCMRIRRRAVLVIATLFVILLTSDLTRRQVSSANQTSPLARREDAYRANNIGVALLEQFKFSEAAEQFRRALQIDPTLALARINLCIALYYEPEPESAL